MFLRKTVMKMGKKLHYSMLLDTWSFPYTKVILKLLGARKASLGLNSEIL